MGRLIKLFHRGSDGCYDHSRSVTIPDVVLDDHAGADAVLAGTGELSKVDIVDVAPANGDGGYCHGTSLLSWEVRYGTLCPGEADKDHRG
jgi:hypothetical protein